MNLTTAALSTAGPADTLVWFRREPFCCGAMCGGGAIGNAPTAPVWANPSDVKIKMARLNRMVIFIIDYRLIKLLRYYLLPNAVGIIFAGLIASRILRPY